MLETNPPQATVKKRGYKPVFERHPELVDVIQDFENWFKEVNKWWEKIEGIPDNIHASRKEVLENFHFSSQGLELLERLKLDIHPENRDSERVEYDIKKLLRAVITLPTIARLTGKHLDRKSQNITTIFKEIIEETIHGKPKVAVVKMSSKNQSAASANEIVGES